MSVWRCLINNSSEVDDLRGFAFRCVDNSKIICLRPAEDGRLLFQYTNNGRRMDVPVNYIYILQF